MRTQAKERKAKEMIKDVPLTGVFVNDQEAALDFYTNKLGLEKIQDQPYGEGTRWITVSPAGSGIMISLEKAEQDYEKDLRRFWRTWARQRRHKNPAVGRLEGPKAASLAELNATRRSKRLPEWVKRANARGFALDIKLITKTPPG
jgi:catechol 2,3-dioxygenase-like lactoylglutathione lyase family enzyme